MNFNRVSAIVLRHIFLTMHQLERFADMFIWPIVGILLWGFMSSYLGATTASLPAFLMGGLILWIVFERVGTSVGVDFMYEVWDRNIVNILASPIKVREFLTGLVIVSIAKVLVAFMIMWLVAAVFFGFNLSSLGVSLMFLWANVVIFAVSLGIFNVALAIRYGATIGPLTWILPFVLQPFVAVFYPVSVMPPLVQKIAWFIPLTHVFEGMRATISSGKMDTSQLAAAFLLNLVYFAISVGLFVYMFNLVKKKGTLVKL